MHRRTKALSIAPAVRKAVEERDRFCIFCGSHGRGEGHYISRAKSGKGIVENIITVCRPCHDHMDNSTDRAVYLARAREYLEVFYPGFTDEDRRYRK